MPVTAINDNTFFILYSLTKKPSIEITKIVSFYNDFSYENLVKNFDILTEFQVDIKLSFYQASDIPLNIIEKIEQYKDDICKSLENIEKPEKIPIIVKNLIPYAITCNFSCADTEILKEKIEEYLATSVKSRERYFYLPEIHFQVLKKVKNWALKTQTSPYKISISRFLERTGEQDNSKYAFFHFLYEQEKAKNLEISELNVYDDKPLIIFENWKEKMHRPKKIQPTGSELVRFQTLHLYENGILNTAKPNEFLRCENLEVEVFKLFFNRPNNISYTKIAEVLGINVKEVPKRISKNRIKMKKIAPLKDVEYFHNNRKNKTYSLIFQKK